MGGSTTATAFADTGTDIVAVEGKDCADCLGRGYDPASNIAAGRASLDS